MLEFNWLTIPLLSGFLFFCFFFFLSFLSRAFWPEAIFIKDFIPSSCGLNFFLKFGFRMWEKCNPRRLFCTAKRIGFEKGLFLTLAQQGPPPPPSYCQISFFKKNTVFISLVLGSLQFYFNVTSEGQHGNILSKSGI